MKAVRIHQYGGPEVMILEETERPIPAPDEILVKVYASGVNPVDWVIRNGANENLRPFLIAHDLRLGCGRRSRRNWQRSNRISKRRCRIGCSQLWQFSTIMRRRERVVPLIFGG